MSTDVNGTECLLTDPRRVKEAVIKHYKTFAGSPPSITNTRASMNNRWSNEYSPLTNINERIYSNLLAEVTDEEWSLAISSLLNNKAAGLSQIPYEMLKHLTDNAALYLRNMVSNCFATSFIPDEWKQAIIYPIPKPQDWNCYLKNTRPITLLDTARKLTTRIMYNRISAVLAKHKVLTGGNFAGLPGGSCNPPIAILEAIINDAQKHDKCLFLFQQDISKAFDSMDTNMLRLAMERLKIPKRFIDLTLEFFSDRTNKIITAYGNTDPYEVQMGIDQGEVLSPLLWVIYLDPLLTVLNRENIAPYCIDADNSIPVSSISTLGYMDDTNLLSSSTQGLTHMLSIAQEFYSLNNTKINFDKAMLICNRDPNDNRLPLPDTPTSYSFAIETNNFDITPLTKNQSFRFLGVWFTLSLSPTYVKKQCRTESSLFSNKLRNKRLTSDQLTYLHNMVLIPKLDFRLKTTLLSEQDCLRISSVFRRVFKNSLKINISIPNAFLQYNKAYELINLFQRQITNHVSNFSKIIHGIEPSSVKNIMLHRLYSIQKDIHIPHSPLLINSFNTFKHTKCFKTDYIFRLLFFAHQFNIGFAQTLPTEQSVNYHTPIYTLFQDKPDLYAKSLYLFKKHNIEFLSDCIADDCLTMLPFRSLIKRNSSHRPSQIVPKWYHHLVEVTADHANSIHLKEEYSNAQRRLLINTTHEGDIPNSSRLGCISVPNRNCKNSYWCAKWDDNTSSLVFGRLIKNTPTKITAQHWIRRIDDSLNRDHTPSSQIIKLIECQGCPLNDPSAKLPSKGRLPDPRLTNLPCLITGPHSS